MAADRDEETLRAHLRGPADPAEVAAGQRAWAAVRGTLPAPRRRQVDWRGALALVVVAFTAAVLVASPPRAALAELVRRAVGPAPARPAPPARPVASAHLPGGGRLLLSGRGGAVVLGAGTTRRLARPVSTAGWSAAGRFVAVAHGSRLLAFDLRGVTRWVVAMPGGARVHGVAWDPRDGFRVAYLAGGDARTPAALHVVGGDGRGDRQAGTAQPGVTPAWRPRRRHELAWVAADGQVVLARVDQRVLRWTSRTRSAHLGRIADLAWSDDGTRLLVVGAVGTLLVSGESGAVLRRTRAPAGTRNVAAAFAPGSARRFALTRQGPGGRSRLLTWVQHPGRTLLTVDGGLSAPQWSPDGRWIAVASGHADALVLLHPRHGRLAALRTLPGLRRRFGGGHFPQLEGWCCRR